MEQLLSNPYKDKPCNYKSYSDYCDPATCWCSKSLQWEREKGAVAVTDIMKQLQRINMKQQTKKIQEIEKDEVFTIPGEDGEYVRRGMLYRGADSCYVASNIAALVEPKLLEEDTVVIPTGEYFDIEPLV